MVHYFAKVSYLLLSVKFVAVGRFPTALQVFRYTRAKLCAVKHVFFNISFLIFIFPPSTK